MILAQVEGKRHIHNKVHTIVTNLAKIQSGYYYLISLLFLETIVPDALNPKTLPLLPLRFEYNGYNY